MWGRMLGNQRGETRLAEHNRMENGEMNTRNGSIRPFTKLKMKKCGIS